MQLLKENIPQLDLPVHTSKKGNYVSDLEKYLMNPIPIMNIHVCPSGCMAYTGDAINSTSCKNCSEVRYTPCKYFICKYNNNKSKCRHKDRVPRKVIKYRSIKSIIIHLLTYELFRELIQYEYFDMENFFDRDQSYYDLKKCDVYKKHYNELKQNFQKLYPNSIKSISKLY